MELAAQLVRMPAKCIGWNASLRAGWHSSAPLNRFERTDPELILTTNSMLYTTLNTPIPTS